MLHTVNGIEIPRIDKALDWYCKSYPIYQRSEFFPVIECGPSFRKKFGKIEDAMQKTLFGGTPESEKEKHTVIAHVIGKPTMDTRYDDLIQDRK
jgi:hypothetical protein